VSCAATAFCEQGEGGGATEAGASQRRSTVAVGASGERQNEARSGSALRQSPGALPCLEPTLHGLLIAMARALLDLPEAWLKRRPAFTSRGSLECVGTLAVPMVLDGNRRAGFPTYRFLQRIYYTPGMALFRRFPGRSQFGALARSSGIRRRRCISHRSRSGMRTTVSSPRRPFQAAAPGPR